MKKNITLLPIAFGLFFCSVFTPAYSQAKKSKPTTTVTRSVSATQTAADGNQFVVVTITIDKDAFRGPAQITETLSSDLMATPIKTSGASFSCKSGKAEFDWTNISDDREVIVSYSIKPVRTTAESQTVTGQLVYSNHTFPIESSSFSVKFSGKEGAKVAQTTQTYESVGTSSNTLDDLYYIIFGNYPGGGSDETYSAPMKAAPVKTASAPVKTTTTPPPAPKQVEATAPAPPVVQQKPAVVETPKTTAPATTTTTTTTAPPVVSAPVKTASAPAPTSPAATGDLVYHIQIAAVGDKSKAGEVLKQYGITEEPILEAAGANATRVMIGNYSNLSSAKTRMDALRTKGLTGGFIVPYYKGKRTTMQEAAKHTGQ